MGLKVILNEKPDLIVSGINRGSNAGRNALYSGTVGGAIEGILQGIQELLSHASITLIQTIKKSKNTFLKLFNMF